MNRNSYCLLFKQLHAKKFKQRLIFVTKIKDKAYCEFFRTRIIVTFVSL